MKVGHTKGGRKQKEKGNKRGIHWGGGGGEGYGFQIIKKKPEIIRTTN
jgi:hypothetical protein